MNRLHRKLAQKYQAYHNWHQTKHHNKAHWGVLTVFTLILFSLFIFPWQVNFQKDSSVAIPSIQTQKTTAAQTWQQTLEQSFAHVETFDELQDWGNGLTGDPNSLVTVNLPQKTTGGQGLIDAWQWDGNGGIQGNAIANHGQADVFRGNGKSLKLGYDWQGKAPSKIDIAIDDGTGNGGYSEAHIFFMVKMPNFLPNDGTGIYWWDALKFFYPAMGFRAPKQFGTPAFAALNPVTNAAVNNSYGQNHQVINIEGGSHMSGLAGKSNFISLLTVANNDCSSYQYQDYGAVSSYNSSPANQSEYWHFDNNLNPLYFAHDWFGIELRFKTGTPNTADGEFEIWVYDKYGNVVYNGWVKNFVQVKTCQAGGQTWYDNEMNKWNKFTWGENRLRGFSPYSTCDNGILCANAPTGQKQFADPSVTDHFEYLDDIIINNQRIGPKYFSLLNGTIPPPDITPPSIPTNLAATSVSSTQINLSWTASTDDVGVTGYKIYRCAGLTCAPTTQIGTSATNSFSDTGLTASTAYTYTVSAYDAVGNESGESGKVLMRTYSSSFNGSFGSQSSSKNVEWGFDFVETFDNLRDWKGTILNDDVMVWKNGVSTFPKHSDGSNSNWEFYSSWKPLAGNNWIANHGPENVWGGTGKSAIIDLSNNGWGPNGFGLYFGDGSPTSGYDDIYIFHMMRMDKNQWPTYIDPGTNIGTYTEGQDYAYFWSWKSGVINLGMDDTHKYNGSQNVYSPFHIISHIKPEYAGAFGKKMSMVLEPYDDPNRYSYWATEKAVHDLLPGWWGVEYHFRNQNNVTYMDVWIYDANGNSWQIINNRQVSYTSQPASHKWNDWFFGVNNSGTYKWGPTMNSTYYIDDFIINGSKIGPKYFSLSNGNPPPTDIQPPSIPQTLTATAISASQINLSWTASTDDVGVTGYKVYRNGQLVNSQSVNSLIYNDTGLTASTAYTYAVSAYDAAGNESAQSQPVSATTLSQFKPSDFNQDGIVNQLDFDILKQDFNRTDKPVSDLNQDGIVDSRDLGIMMSNWGK